MQTNVWKVLLVDDDDPLHRVLKEASQKIYVNTHKITSLHAKTQQEVHKLLGEHPDIAIVFIDISLGTPTAGLALVEYIRNELKNEEVRIILLASKKTPPMPPEEIIEKYDINDYKEYDEISEKKLFNVIRTAIKQYAQFKELKESRDAIYERMITNEVTHLPNRIKLSQKLDTSGNKSLILINIDDFSLINDHKGFEYGDKVLRAFAEFLKQKYGGFMDVFHLQSDVFALLCYEEDYHKVDKYIKGIKENIQKHTFVLDNGDKLHLTATLGVVLNEDGNMIQKAEFALKEARLYGKNNLTKYSDDLNIVRTIHANSLWSERIREAFESGGILTYYQPIYNIQQAKISKYEALVRLKYKGKIYTPIHFLDAALYSGQIFEIFKQMFHNVCSIAKKSDKDFTINVSEYDMKDPHFTEFIHETLKECQIESSRITFEVLEYTSISSDKKIQNLLNALHDAGFHIAIDDFGSHCSNFAQLNNLKIDFIKIDGSFIKHIIEDKNCRIVTSTIIDFAHKKEIPVIAEFVSSKEIFDYVAKMGADYAQGYFIAEPKPQLV
jgi:diguanylate cyclase (GGDEF)-like protein